MTPNPPRKKLHKRKCKVCRVIFQKLKPLQSVCSHECAIAHARALAEKNNRLQLLKLRREHKAARLRIKTRAEWLREAQNVFNQFIRLRDQHLPCISCGRYHAGQYHSGHFRTVGSAPELRFNEQNVHKQCAPCNNHLSGNILNYRIQLIKKIGLEKVEWLEGKHEPIKLTIEEIKALKAEYSARCKALIKLNQGE